MATTTHYFSGDPAQLVDQVIGKRPPLSSVPTCLIGDHRWPIEVRNALRQIRQGEFEPRTG